MGREYNDHPVYSSTAVKLTNVMTSLCSLDFTLTSQIIWLLPSCGTDTASSMPRSWLSFVPYQNKIIPPALTHYLKL